MPKKANTSIPLLCNLCPKNPTFSDVSHLLTHISSKSHLSNRFKLQIRSQNEPEARRLLTDFDNWYNENGLEELLSERLAAKEQKKMTKRPRNASVATHPSIAPTANNMLDELRSAASIYRPPVPRMHSWSTESYAGAPAENQYRNPWKQASSETPTMKRNIPNFTQSRSPALSSPAQSTPTPLKSDETEEESEKDASKLKGVFWPGMHLFDSATAEMKRMRNQKKDGTALEQMKMSSAKVEPTEQIFNPDGEFRRARDIFDESTEDDPDNCVVAPTPKKRRTRKAMAEANPNIPRRRRSPKHPGKKVPAYKRRATDTGHEETLPKKPTRRFLTGRFAQSTDEQEEFRLTMEDLGRSKRLSIFCDRDVAADTEANSPGRTESPLEQHRFDFSDGLPSGRNKIFMDDAAQNSPTPVPKHIPMRYIGKENLDSGRINPRMMPAITSGWNHQVFQTDSFNPLFSHSHTHSFSYEEREIFQGDFKPSGSSFNGDFKPMAITDAFMGMECNGFQNHPGHGMGNDIQFGR